MSNNNRPGLFLIIVASIFNGVIAVSIASLVVLPIAWLVLIIFGTGLHGGIKIIIEKLDIFFVIFSVVAIFEIVDRIIRGSKKSKIIRIIRDKEDRW